MGDIICGGIRRQRDTGLQDILDAERLDVRDALANRAIYDAEALGFREALAYRPY